MNRTILLERISFSLSILKAKVLIENTTNDFGINLILENTYLKILNVIYGDNFTNTNAIQRNYPGIDGIDIENKKAIQVSSTATNHKIESTVDQILKNESYKDFDRVLFFFIKGKNKLSKDFVEKINIKIKNKFAINFESDLLEPEDIYTFLFNCHDIEKIIEVKKILDEELEFLPLGKVSGIDFIGISFDPEDNENAKYLIEELINLGYNIVINSKVVYRYFQTEKPRYFDFIIYVHDEEKELKYLNKYLVLLSNGFIKKNINSNTKTCNILNSCLNKRLKPKALTFHTYLDRIDNKDFKNSKNISIGNKNKIHDIINDLFQDKPTSKYNFEEIIDILKILFPSYELNRINSDRTFCLINLKMKDNDNELNYLIFNHEYKRTEVINEFNINYKKTYSRNLNILIPKDYNQSTELRKESLKERFDYATNIAFIDEFLFEKSLGQIKREEILKNENFIEPLFKLNDEEEKISDILDWIKNDTSTPVAFIKGAGGIGKTTVSEKIHDEIIKSIDNNIVIFIDAIYYIEEIKKRDIVNNNIFDLNSIYELCKDKTETVNINTLKINFLVGNITVIIDGIDEIISTITNFNLKNFVEDLQVIKDQIGRGKIIINSRDLYINELEAKDPEFIKNNKVFELLKFDKNNAEKFFKKKFPSIQKKQNKKLDDCLLLLLEFYTADAVNVDSNDSQYIYSPFVLEIIALIVENDFEYDEIEHDFDSKILIKNNNNDYLIYKICQREIAKKELHGHIPNIDDFLKFLSLIAIEKNGFITDEDFINYLRMVKIDLSSEKVRTSIRDNPFFITISNNNYQFRFDFYSSLFKLNGIYLKLIDLEYSLSLSDSYIEMLSSDFKYNSLIFNALIKKIKIKGITFPELLSKFKKLINEIKEYRKNDENKGFIFLKNHAISNLLIFILIIKDQHSTNIEIIKDIFLDKNQNSGINVINGLNLIEIPYDKGFVFDFSELFFINTTVDSYPEFINCTFSKDTYFAENCIISNITPLNVNFNKISASKENFSDKIITSDNSLFKLMKLKEEGGEKSSESLKRFFKSFYSSNNNRIGTEAVFSSITSGKQYCIEIDAIIEILTDCNVIESVDEDKIVLKKDFCNKIDKYLTQNIPFIEINKGIKRMDMLRNKIN